MTPEEIRIRQSAIDMLYQDILSKANPFPEEIRHIFHEHMNRLTKEKNKTHVTEKE